jgi:hypothetical protein
MNKYLLIFLFIALAFMGTIIAEKSNEEIKLTEGKNYVLMNFSFNPIYAADLVKIYPEIAAISWNNSEEEIGYVNAFGGIGKNFVIYSNQSYEIITKQNTTLNLR